MHPTTSAAVAIAIAAGSEIIGMLPIKDNSWLQLVLRILQAAFPAKKEK